MFNRCLIYNSIIKYSLIGSVRLENYFKIVIYVFCKFLDFIRQIILLQIFDFERSKEATVVLQYLIFFP